MSEPIRLFVGTSANGEDYEAEAVLEYTARQHCSMPLEITWMRQAATGPWSGWKSCARNRTAFSSFRWSPPSVCGYEGRSIYTDVDFFFLGDLAELWTQPIDGSHIMLIKGPDGKLNHSSCILFDNEKCKGHIPDLDKLKRMPDAHSEMLNYLRPRKDLVGPQFGDWNCSKYEKMAPSDAPIDLSGVSAYHFTRIEHQLHLRYAKPRLKAEGKQHWYTAPVGEHPSKPLVELYDSLYREAVVAGYTPDKYTVAQFDGATRRDFAYSHSRVSA